MEPASYVVPKDAGRVLRTVPDGWQVSVPANGYDWGSEGGKVTFCWVAWKSHSLDA